jgi:hypothetical protein
MKFEKSQQVTDAEFASAWQRSATPAEVAELVGCTVGAARSKAWNMRKRGFELKRMRQGGYRHGRSGQKFTGRGDCYCGQPRVLGKDACARCLRAEAVGYDGIIAL